MANNDGVPLDNPLVAPPTPENPDDDSEAGYHYVQQLTNHLYTVATAKYNPPHFRALRDPRLSLHRELIRQAGLPWDGDLLSLQGALINIIQQWDNSAVESCPISFSEDETRVALQEAEEWEAACADLGEIRDMIGIDLQGWVSNELFDEAVRENQRLLRYFAEHKGMEVDELTKVWPFTDTE